MGIFCVPTWQRRGQSVMARLVRHLTRFRDFVATDLPIHLRRIDLSYTGFREGDSTVRFMRLLAPHVQKFIVQKKVWRQSRRHFFD